MVTTIAAFSLAGSTDLSVVEGSEGGSHILSSGSCGASEMVGSGAALRAGERVAIAVSSFFSCAGPVELIAGGMLDVRATGFAKAEGVVGKDFPFGRIVGLERT